MANNIRRKGGSMRLRNKKTGEVFESFRSEPIDLYFYSNEHEGKDMIDRKTYQSLAELNEEWEDYIPAEPLIKDEKVRKAVREWAEANGVGTVLYKEDNYRFYADDTEIGSMIEFENIPEYIGLRHEHRYTIAELCGEEEE